MPADVIANALLPTGMVTFMFTDIEGSTSLWDAHPEVMRKALARHDSLMHETIASANGHVFKTVGDAFCAVFSTARDAVSAALSAQEALATERWPEEAPIKVRIALHTGVVEIQGGDYFGPPLNRVARLLSTAYGGQTLTSLATCELSRDALPHGASLHDLGVHRLKDLARPERIFELQHHDRRRKFPPIKTLSTHPNNLPQQLTSFIGRAKEISDIEALLAKNRLLTLTGSGGAGKTRLGLQVAAETLPRFPDGAWFVELAPIVDPGLVPKALCAVVGIAEESGKTITQTLVEHLKSKELLILLDNCEHLLESGASLSNALLRQCPGVRILASSRESLGVGGEQIYRVPSLSLPDTRRVQSLEALATYEAVQLFLDRARLVRADFHVADQDTPALASICTTLDGIPLAIELAAARVATLSVEEIDTRLDRRFGLLTSTSRTALPRHQTLRALIDWSYDLLNPSEQRLLQQLSVFSDGWTLDAAERTASAVISETDVLDLLTSLSNKSLTVWDTAEGRSRYRLLETVRQYAREKLRDSGDEGLIRARHLDYYLALAENAESKLDGAEQGTWLQRLEREHSNLRSALERCVVDRRYEEGLRMCGALQRYWATRGHFSEGRDWCERILGMPGAEMPTPQRASALQAAGLLAYYQSDYGAAQRHLEESLSIRKQLGDRPGVCASLNYLGNVAIERGDYDSARTTHEASLTIARELGNQLKIANSLLNLGVIAENQKRHQDARTLGEQGLAIRRRLDDRRGIAVALNNLGIVAFEQGDYESARTMNEESLAIRRELGDRRGISLSLGNLANLALRGGDLLAARALGAESLVIGREIGDQRQIAHALDGLAAVHAGMASPVHAAHIWGAVERLREAASLPSPIGQSDYDAAVAMARAQCVGDDFSRAWQEGRTLTLEQAVVLALAATTSDRNETRVGDDAGRSPCE